MGNPITKLFAGGAKEAVEAVANVVDRFVSTPEEKEAVRQSIEEEITKRWQADSLTDSWLSKNVRPLTLATVMIFLVLMVQLEQLVVMEMILKVFQKMFHNMII